MRRAHGDAFFSLKRKHIEFTKIFLVKAKYKKALKLDENFKTDLN
jgi:hypothetical protein